jgi:glycosyltransferase involved in cell wall biosynthesis
VTVSPLVTVVMPVRDPHPEHFRDAIESVLQQTLADFELLVVEDAGERPGESARPVVVPSADPRVRHIVNREPGIASARNVGLRAARASLVAMLDADDTCAPQRLRRQVERMAVDPTLTVLGSWVTVVDEGDRITGARRYPTAHHDVVAALPVANPIAQPSVLLRVRPVLEAGGYRDRTCEDYDLWCRLALRGARFANLPEPLIHYRIHPSSMKSRKLRASLRDTIAIKHEHWRGRLGWRGRLRLLGERAMLLLPPRLVLALFSRLHLRAGWTEA